MGTPSTTYNGLFAEKEDTPRIITFVDPPVVPEFEILTPATLPCRPVIAFILFAATISLALTVVAA
ncbi:hypothetical protein D3C72_1200110 [compost metagenome]